MKYNSATIDATLNDKTTTLDLETVNSEEQMIDELWATFTAVWDEIDPDAENHTNELPEGVTFTNPQGFARHLFDKASTDGVEAADFAPTANFDTIAEAWSNETDEDRRIAMGEYLDDMGADDLSDFDEAYNGQYNSGAAFAEQFADDIGAVDDRNAGWICIDWERTWDANLRHDYHITDSGHVFRNL